MNRLWMLISATIVVSLTVSPSPLFAQSRNNNLQHGEIRRVDPAKNRRPVMLYAKGNLQGRRQALLESDRNLADNRLNGNDIRGIFVPDGWAITLFEGRDYRGRSVSLAAGEHNFDRKRHGLSSIGSIRLAWKPGRTPDTAPGDRNPQVSRPTTQRGIELFAQTHFRGRQAVILEDTADLSRTRIGNDALRSLRIPPGRTVTLFEHGNFRGKSETLSTSDKDLSNNRIGLDRVSSIRIDWREQAEQVAISSGVILYSDVSFRGRKQHAEEDLANLRFSRVGNDAVRSLEIAPGYEVTLFEHKNFRGRSITLQRSISDLDQLEFGRDSASSIRILGPGQRSTPSGPPPKGVTLYSSRDYRGRSLTLSEDRQRLNNSRLGNDRVASIRIAPGYRATLFEDDDYRGRYEIFYGDDDNLADNTIGINRVSSLRVMPLIQNPAGEYGVILCADRDFAGQAEVFYGNDRNLDGNRVGNDRVRSLIVPPGCRVTLFEHADFRGRSAIFEMDDSDLSDNPIGLDQASSIRIERMEAQAYEVVLFRDRDFRGEQLFITESIANLEDSPIGNDSLSSIRVPPGLRVILYEHANFRGRSEELTHDDRNLSDNAIGNDRVSSIRLSEDHYQPVEEERGVGLFSDSNFRGRNDLLFQSDPDLSDNAIGNDSLSSIQVPHGYRVILYEHTNYRGRSEEINGDDHNLANNTIGNDRVSSIRIEAIRGAYPKR